jgi:uncharacterized membrane protein YgcG
MKRTDAGSAVISSKIFFPMRGRKILPILILLLAIAGCGSLEIPSHWRRQAIEIDGKIGDWQNAMVQIEDKPFIVGILNDSNYLYISFVTDDQSLQRQITFRGLTVWFDHEGGEDKRFGIKYPLGVQAMGAAQYGRGSEEERNPDDSLRERPPLDTNEAEIVGPTEKDHHRVRIVELKQIAMKMDVSNGRLTYEMRVPLVDNGPDPYAIGTRIGTAIGIGFETAARAERQQSGESERSDMPGGGMGRGGGGGGGRRGRGGGGGYGGGRSSRSGQQSEPLSLWAKVQLATPESAN